MNGELIIGVVVLALVCLIGLVTEVLVRRRRKHEQEQRARLDAFLAHTRALKTLAADARRRPDFQKLPRI